MSYQWLALLYLYFTFIGNHMVRLKQGKTSPSPTQWEPSMSIAPMERDLANIDRVTLSETHCNFVILMLHRHMASAT